MGGPIGAAKRILEGEDHFETIKEGETARQFLGVKLAGLAGIIALLYTKDACVTRPTRFSAWRLCRPAGRRSVIILGDRSDSLVGTSLHHFGVRTHARKIREFLPMSCMGMNFPLPDRIGISEGYLNC
jgi:hypothetical protein